MRHEDVTGLNAEKGQKFVEVVREKRDMLWRLAMSLLKNGADAEDAVSAGVENTWRHLYRIREDGALAAYLTRSVINAARDEIRRRGRVMSLDPFQDTLEAPPADRGIAEYIDFLEEKYRLPILLKYGENMREREIAKALRIPRGTVSSRLSRGLDILRKEMNREGPDDVRG
ncbi:MAG: sigma-70 family RNA polymerase sigma factor [Clostridia bacterium]|nr:sigma-70 family RNA polymerase sigma factor [Clostridia bacterium]